MVRDQGAGDRWPGFCFNNVRQAGCREDKQEVSAMSDALELELPSELRMLRQLVRDFIRNEVRPLEYEMEHEQYALPPEKLAPLQKKARELGLWCLGAPQEYGGGGLGIFALTVIAEEASQHRNGAYNPALGAFGHEPPYILYSGTPDQIQRYVIPTIEGRRSGFVAITEPTGGSDPARAIQTRAVRHGDRWILNGRKVFITGVQHADYGVVFARTGEGRYGITAFIVEVAMKGFSWKPIPVIRPYYPNEVLLEDVEVPDENRLGDVGKGFAVAQKWLVRNRLPYAAGCIGIGQAAHDMAVDYARQRETFGSRLADKQAIQWMLVDNEIDLRSARWLTWDAAWRAERGRPHRMEVSLAKLVATEAAGRVVDRAIQIHGGMGVTKDMPFERWYRELRVKRIGEGPSEVHRMVVARDLLNPAGRQEVPTTP
jgi:acyl-CoA dehydrogenase